MKKLLITIFILNCLWLAIIPKSASAWQNGSIIIDGYFSDWNNVLADQDNISNNNSQITTTAWTHNTDIIFYYIQLDNTTINEQTILIYIDANNNSFLESQDYIYKLSFKKNETQINLQLYNYQPVSKGDSLTTSNGTYGALLQTGKINYNQVINNKIEIGLPYQYIKQTAGSLINSKIVLATSANIPNDIKDTAILNSYHLQPQGEIQNLNLLLLNPQFAPHSFYPQSTTLILKNTGNFTIKDSNIIIENDNPKLKKYITNQNIKIPDILPKQIWTTEILPIYIPNNINTSINFKTSWQTKYGQNFSPQTITLQRIPTFNLYHYLLLIIFAILLITYQLLPHDFSIITTKHIMQRRNWLIMLLFLFFILIIYFALKNSYALNILTFLIANTTESLLAFINIPLNNQVSQQLWLSNQNQIIIFEISLACSALFETLFFASIILFYHNYTWQYRLKALITGCSFIQFANIIRILFIILFVYNLGVEWLNIAHNLFGMLFFYIALILIYGYFLTWPHLKKIKATKE